MLYHSFYSFSGGGEILSRVEICRMLSEVFADCSGHGETKVRVDVDFAYRALSGLTQEIFGHAFCTGHIPAEFIYHIDKFGDNGRSAVQHDGELRQLFDYLIENVKSQLSFAFKLVSAVACSYRDSEGVYACALYEFYDFARPSIGCVLRIYFNVVLYAGESAQLTFDYDAVVVSIFYYALCQLDIFFKG